MNSSSQHELGYGPDQSPRRTCLVEAGPLVAQLVGQDLRYIRAGGIEVVRRIYVAVRDHNWLTIPGQVSGFKLDTSHGGFQASFSVHHKQRAIDLQWRGQFRATPDGVLTCSMVGQAASTFPYNRIGFCVLHPVETTAGQPYRAQTQAGTVRSRLPSLIGPQRFENGIFIPLFPPFNQLVVNLRGGAVARFDFEGDWFEMEDQRNWTDNSFKTYCTPLALSFPKTAQVGQEFSQRITLVLERKSRSPKPLRQNLVLSVGKGLGCKLPELGLQMPSQAEPLSASELGLFQRLRLNHLRADLPLANAKLARNQFHQAAATCRLLGCRMEAAIFLTHNAQEELQRLQSWIEPEASIARFLVLAEEEPCTDARWVGLARERLQALAPSAEFFAGTNAYFAELNRTRPDMAALDGLVYSLNPQVHANDELSLAENLEAQAATVQTARAFSGARRLSVSPVTMKPRYNANATAPDSNRTPTDLPASVDPRQMSLFVAGWTVGSLKYLAESGADAVTYYETIGWRGLVESRTGSKLPRHFPSAPGQLFPVYHVFAQVAEWKSCEIARCDSSQPLRVVGLAFRKPTGLQLLVANLTSEPQVVRLVGLGRYRSSVRVLDAQNAQAAMVEPDFFARATPRPLPQREPTLELTPYALSVLNASAE